ncbi:hypothetical protein CSPAE12_01384 [Colletotrichum incanum]|nr:hypothetical protein CSPAE12_01384 [Colletotrichum incanum]
MEARVERDLVAWGAGDSFEPAS